MRHAAKRLIGLILETGHYHASRALLGIHRYALEHDWQLLLQDVWRHDPLEEWLSRGVDGFILQAITPELLAFSRRLPVVNISSVRRDTLPSVSVDHHEVGRLAAQHLLGLPLSHFAFCGQEAFAFVSEEADAFAESIRHAGYKCHRLQSNRMSEVVQWLRRLPRPLGLMASSDLYASYVVRACAMADVTLKEQVAVIGLGNNPELCTSAIPSLTSIDQGSDRIGYEAAELLDQSLRGRKAKSRRLAPGAVVTRESTLLKGYDPDVYEAMRLIHEPGGLELSVEMLASQIGIERRTMERRFLRALGRSPRDEIRRSRISRAQELLAQTELSMPNIALRCGFGSATRLGVAFRNETGVTPTEYRRHSRGA